ncbi:nucleotidyltransferase domain-containing protein [Cellulomonas palmilytica]|uniref:nucleotidyltransferase domain-containing protein n=1 Tax=Cellulomonas palmilytica TaxID=2608402 RepID=UPI001F36D604|nr:nucleotidyltransferase domain-containing protein [Cellulomonas palmilytica]UJP38885.1 nucleotidyltransferase domain-containing protein [Cellulomonas palmilytica]
MDATHPLAVVTPTLDGDVLTHLALTRAAFTPGQLARLLPPKSRGENQDLRPVSVEGVRKVLNRLAHQGIVTATRVGNSAVTYELNREHLAADGVVALANQARTLRTRLEEHLEGWGTPPVYAALFGSWARGAATVDSDVDLFLVRPDDADEDEWADQVDELQHRVSRWTGNDARPFVIDETDLPPMATEPVLASIRTEGLTVHGDPNWLRKRVKPRRLIKRNMETS